MGDSIFDNAAYTSGQPDVERHLARFLPLGWQTTMLARDGATLADLPRQLARIPADASQVAISIGGNDVLQHLDLLSLRVTSSLQVLNECARRLRAFEEAYRRAIGAALAPGRPTAVCTIYNGAFERERADAARAALAIFNDAILRVAGELRLDVLELRSICNEPADYANAIEPSGQGGAKIARGIAAMFGAVRSSATPGRLWAVAGEVR